MSLYILRCFSQVFKKQTGQAYRFEKLSFLVVICTLSLGTLTGCQLDEQDLEVFKKTRRGHRQLATYALDTSRPTPLRGIAISSLANKRRYNELLTIFRRTSEFEEESTEQLHFISEEIIRHIDKMLVTLPSLEQMSQVAELVFLLMHNQEARDILRTRSDLLTRLARWPLRYLRGQRKVPLPPRAQTLYTTPKDFLIALLYTATREDGVNDVFEVVHEDVSEHLSNINYVLKIHEVIRELRDPKITERFTPLLLSMARKAYEKTPEKIDKAFITALLENHNLTVLRFLVDICRDQQVSPKLLAYTIDQTMQITQRDQVQDQILPILQRVLRSQYAHSALIFIALEWSWILGDKTNLRELLVSISPHFKMPVSGNLMKRSVDRFCNDVLESSKEQLREQLQGLMFDFKEQSDLWPARLVVVSCVQRLYPDDFPKLMRRDQLFQRYYQNDAHSISAWRSDRNVTFGEIVSEYMNPTR